ncbi:transcription initiation at TATA-containing promoter protein [Elasticomyces elasticus]|uniref:Transcription initiation at TATA-containing promoter protein n=1 Tax=Exophiala sideris TaxID=1016849 RepID=A0ABR0JQ16_9EURO|nr:transcription initiation at TATA-containing promoter protein [Elasticomyces elasticus]KAK5039710.1 transcription initiation at TATA-containing promoter protein [Exophiala sideris]KAK5041262.1 transcription initiation at TATA-containing promoter protein [Exophiala sideris]KAK5068088.1 transcription initiation at TATA-containing promoter protein [Exophiala sideris]KAK5187389.1 transcription initiation at TATA-containing promoter protein [Eurotiomycetes sp. CCFEE 6388]
MDVEMQMEANGLPAQFTSASDRPEESHIADNLAASISNSETPIDALPSKAALTESVSHLDPVQAVSEPVLTSAPEAVPEAVVESVTQIVSEVPAPATNGHMGDSLNQSLAAVPDSQPQLSLDDSTVAPAPPTVSVVETTMTESFVPSSIPTEIQSSATPADTTQTTMDLSELAAIPPQAPESNLRTSPHADALAPEAVAEIEAQKHELDNLADAPTISTKPDAMDISSFDESIALPEQPTVADIGLPSPPAQSPPPAPQPAAATLPEDEPIEPVVEPPTTSEPVSETIVAPEPLPVPTEEPLPVPEALPVPAEEPRAPAPTPAVPAPADFADTDMIDVLPAKQARPRDDDGESERAAKRFKPDASSAQSQEPAFKVPDVPAVASSPMANGDSNPAANGIGDGDDSVTPTRLAHMKKVISNLKKSSASTAFRIPVDYVALNIPLYPEIIKHPMDLQTIDHRLKQNQYTSISSFVSDFELIVNNCVRFNGPEHGVTQQARKMQSSFTNQMKNLPSASIEEPSKEAKKAAKKQEPTRQAPPRRPSVTTPTPTAAPVAAAASPKSVAALPTPSFAPGPDGIPLIRRDSTLTDGRPKRAIVPTKRNQEFGGGRPKKKKYELQLRFCDEVLKEIASTKNWQMNQYFTHPVDPVALNIPTYFQIIKKPMDLGTVRTKLNNNVYEKAKDFEEDVRLVFKNCYKFNPEGDLVHNAGTQLEGLFNKKWATKDEWIAAREPPSEPQSEADDDEEDEEESEDDAEDSEDERAEKIRLLQKQIEEMSKQMGELTQKKPKKSKSPPAKKSKSKSKKEKPAAGVKDSKEKKEKKKSAPKSKPEKDRYVTFAEKQYISNGIAMLPEKQMQEALKIIQNSVPSLANSDQNEIELDIEEVPNHALLKLLNFVKKYAGPPPDEPKAEPTESYGTTTTTTKSKKSKPMSKHEQEAQIEELKGKLGAYAGPISPNAVQSIETGDSSDDDGDSEESEEE